MNAQTISIFDATEAFAVPGELSLIDCINPHTQKSWINNESLDEIRLRYPGGEVINIEAWSKAKAEVQDRAVEWLEITHEHYIDMLEVLPPAYHLRVPETATSPDQISHGFMVGEPWDHHATTGQPRYSALIKRRGKHLGEVHYFTSNRAMRISEFKTLEN